MTVPFRIAAFAFVIVGLAVWFLGFREASSPPAAPSRTDRVHAQADVPAAVSGATRPAESVVPLQPIANASKRAFKFQFTAPPDGVVASYIDGLIARAEDPKNPDSDAALMAAWALNQCRPLKVPPDTEPEDRPAPPKVCQGLSPALVRKVRGLLKIAAEMGNVEAQFLYGSEYLFLLDADPKDLLAHAEDIVQYKRDAVRFLTEAANQGSVQAMRNLSHAYRDSLLTPKDPFLTYVYMHAASRTGLYPLAGQELARMGTELTPQQVVQAQRAGDQIFAQCCSGKN